MDEYICYEGNEKKNYDRLDKIFISFLDGYEYDSYHIPGMIGEECLKKCGYIGSFPQQLTIPVHLNRAKIDHVIKEESIKEENIQTEKMYMSPSACLHFYPLLENQQIERKIMTTLTQVYRFEERGFNTGLRLWEFNVREIVFIGTAEYVEKMLNMMSEKALKFSHNIDPDAFIKTSNDFFYPNRKNELKCLIQKKNRLKRELIMHINGEEVAVASFNNHNNHFSKAFKFDGDGSIVSGCVGFGMERWVSACAQHKYIV